MEKERKLAVFDVEGVLLPKWRYVPFEVAVKFGPLKFLRIVFIGLLYEIKVISLETALKSIYRSLKGFTLEELYTRYKRMPIILGAFELFEALRRKGWKTALISSGLPEIIVKDLANRLGADYAYGLKLKANNSRFSGEVYGEVMKKNGKAQVLQKILKLEGINPENCVLIADDRNNLQLFPYVKVKIGYNPDFVLAAKSDYVVSGNLTDILQVIGVKTQAGEVGKMNFSRSSIFRSTIHLCGFTVPFISLLIGKSSVITLILAVSLLYTVSEFARIYGKLFPFISSITQMAAVKLEPFEFAAAPLYYAAGILLSLLFFPPEIAYASIAILTLGDGAASIAGRIIGRKTYPFNKAKHVEGTLVGLVLAFSGATLFLSPIKALAGAIMGIIVECLPLPVNDNLTIPLVSGMFLSVLP